MIDRPADGQAQPHGIMMNGFTASLSLCGHPLLKARKKSKMLYLAILEYIVRSCAANKEYADARLVQYRTEFVGSEIIPALTSENCEKAIKALINDFLRPWKRKYLSTLSCDAALILLDDTAVKKACDLISEYLNARKQEKLCDLQRLLFNDLNTPRVFSCVENLITQFRNNREFASKQIMSVMVTANVSAGKSMLINALIGKPITRTRQKACTANLCYIYNKPFEDNRIHLKVDASPLNLNATCDDTKNIGTESVSSIASYFRPMVHLQKKFCLIDTPGVNYALNKNHGKIARKAIAEENYDKLICVLEARNPGSDDEIRHLKYVYDNVPNEKAVFVINQVDRFNSGEDSISESIDRVKADLEKIGFKNPIICPMSAYFSLLLKLKLNNEELSADEQDDFDLFLNKFNKPEYDLSVYYHEGLTEEKPITDDLVKMSFKSGLYSLENILYGGAHA